MVFLLACSPPAPPVLALPAAVPAVDHAESVSVDRFLAPTALGASTDVLCPWARGEAVPDASLARWMAEKRLAWRVIEVGPSGATLDGTPDLRAATDATAAAADALAARCGTAARRDVLVVAGPDVAFADVSPALVQVDRVGLSAWVLVSDTTPDAAALSLRPGALLEVHLRGDTVTGASAAGGPPVDGALDALAPLLDGAGCVRLNAASDASWGAVLTTIDSLRARQIPLHDVPLLPGGPAAPAVAPRPAEAAPTRVPLHGAVSAWPLPSPGRCDVCGCLEPK